MVSVSKKLFVLVWKCLLLRKKNWLLTTFELICPIMVTLAIYGFNLLGNKDAYILKQPIDLYSLDNATDRLKYLAYNPSNTFTNHVMKNIKNAGSLSSVTFFEPLQNELELDEWLKNKTLLHRKSESIGITFKYINMTTNEFTYEIRTSSHKMSTEKIKDALLTPFEAYQNDSSFLVVQIVLDLELLKFTGFKLKQRQILLGELPLKKPPYEMAIYVLYSFIMIAYVFLVASVTREVLQEKYTGIKELMKILGVSSWMIWTHWLIYTLIVQFPVTICMTIILVNIEPTVLQANGFIIWLLFFLFTLDCIFLTFSCSCLFNRPMRGTSICVVAWCVLNMSTMSFIKDPGDHDELVQIFMCLIPLHNLCWAITAIQSFSNNGINWTFDHLFTKGFTGSHISIGLSICIFISEMIFWVLLFIILDVFKPGPYGIAKPLAFVNSFCKKLRSSKNQVKYNASHEFRTSLPTRFELPPQGAKVGIKIRRLRKEYGCFNKVVAVESVDLDIYEGEIMALLGHNGAGKTTMMSLITGMFSPTQGFILVEDKDINTALSHFRQSLGLCTQHNMYFPKLTVIEHLLFFGMLKGMSYSEAKECGVEILDLLNIKEKQNSEVHKLSGGMQRKLCLGISLIGNPKVLILDEPTSGLDPENRRQLWNIILKMRGSRTVLITTHFMEEADALGDRIAIMDKGRVVCCGTTMFLKRIYGTGYTIHVLKKEQSIVDDIYTEIKRQISKVQLKIISRTQVDFVIKEDLVEKFPVLFEKLEEQQKSLGIRSMSVSCTTLEDVFLRVAEKFAEGDYVEGDDKEHIQSITSRLSLKIGHDKVAGVLLFLQICQVLIWKRFIYFYRNGLSSLSTIVCSSALVFLVVWLSKLDTREVAQQNPLTISLNIYPHSISLLKHDENNSKIAKTANKFITHQGGIVTMVPNSTSLQTFALELDKKDFTKYINQYLLALDFIREKFIISYQPKLNIHTPAIAVNMVSNILLHDYSNKNGSITVINHPYVLPQDQKCRKTDLFRVVPQFCWLFFISCALIILMINFIPFLTEERSSGFKHQQTIAGAPTLLYWISNFVFDYCFCFCTVTIFILIISVLGDDVVVSDSHLVGLITQVLIFYSLSGLLFVYLFTFLIDNSVTCNAVFLIYNLAFALFPAFVIYMDIIENYKAFYTIAILLSFNPTFAATISMGHIGRAVLDEQFCRICGETYCTNNTDLLMKMPTNENRSGILIYILFLALSWILYLIIIIFIELDIGRKIQSIFQYSKETSSRYSTFEEDVKEESHQVKAAKESGDTSNPLRVEGLVKKYLFGPKAVNQVTFLVSKGECFGLLGVNGAGKTTTFKILTGDILPNSGDAFVAKYSLIKNRKNYLSCIGYCPQFDALLDKLTGEETLEVIAKIRGIPRKDIKEEIAFLLSMLGIAEHAKKHTITYSGGTKRKLSTAMAFIGNPEVVFLDEPTTGVDPVSRRQLWGVVQARLWAGQAVVLTSHSMEECEALCSRLTIMRGGQMQCIGTLEYLKKKYGKGYTVLIKLLHYDDIELETMKIEFQRVFPESLIKDEHITLIHYQILNPLIPLSELFTEMLEMKKNFHIIEDFNVSNTTLEQLFLTFARKEETVERRRTLFSLH